MIGALPGAAPRGISFVFALTLPAFNGVIGRGFELTRGTRARRITRRTLEYAEQAVEGREAEAKLQVAARTGPSVRIPLVRRIDGKAGSAPRAFLPAARLFRSAAKRGANTRLPPDSRCPDS
jgi:hypothetical protein